MADVIVIGDGPGGLSAALFLAKNKKDVLVFGRDQTAMHAAKLYNYLGFPEILGSDLQKIGREQVTAQGARIVDATVEAIRADGDRFVVEADGTAHDARYIVLSEGKNPKLAQGLGLEMTRDGVPTDKNGRTAVDRVYAVGRMARPGGSQAIVSAGDGAAAALDILAREKGVPVFADWDTP